MDISGTFTIARATPADTKAISEFVTKATRKRVFVSPEGVMDRFGAKGLWLVRDATGQIVGLAGWRAENLVARIDDFLIYPYVHFASAGKMLVESIENAANELQCEVCMLFVPLRASPAVIRFYETCGYERPELEGLPRVWQDTVQEATDQGRYILMKKLREDLVVRPI